MYKNLFQQAGLSTSVALALLAEPGSFHERLQILRRGMASAFHPDTNQGSTTELAATINNAYDQLLELGIGELAAVQAEITGIGEAGSKTLELEFRIQQLSEQLQEVEDNLLDRQRLALKQLANTQKSLIDSASLLASYCLWGKELNIHSPVLIKERELKWSRSTLQARTRLLEARYTCIAINRWGLIAIKEESLRLVSPCLDKDGKLTRFSGDSLENYRNKIRESGKMLYDKVESGGIADLSPKLLVGFAPKTAGASRQLKGLVGGLSINPLTLEALKPETLKELPNKTATSIEEIRKIASHEQPRDKNYYLVVWDPLTLSFQSFEHSEPEYLRVSPLDLS